MPDLKISEIMTMQRELQEKYKGKWTPPTPEAGRDSLLWMMEEVGEVISIIKKRGDKAIMEDNALRSDFIEELVDVMMYYQNMLSCYEIDSQEWSQAFIKKHEKNMARDFLGEHGSYLKNLP